MITVLIPTQNFNLGCKTGITQAYPLGQKWTAEDNKLYKPITKDIVDGVTHELTLQDVENDPIG